MEIVSPSAVGPQCLLSTIHFLSEDHLLKPHCCLNVGDVGLGGAAYLRKFWSQGELRTLFYTYIKLKPELKFHQNNTKHIITNKIVQKTIPSFTL